MRKEIKYVISKKEYEDIKDKMGKILSKDTYTFDNEKYSIKTIYFDNIYDQLLNENINGDIYRKKFRIRIYNNDLSNIFLEKKERLGEHIFKEREKISLDDVEKICSGKIGKIKLDTKLKKELYVETKLKFLKPVIVIEYDRVAFENKKVGFRLTLDSKIFETRDVKSFKEKFRKKDNVYVLEVKYKEIIPKVVSDLIKVATQRQGYSKYKMMRLNKCKIN